LCSTTMQLSVATCTVQQPRQSTLLVPECTAAAARGVVVQHAAKLRS
jgi:hypothetical protein